MNLFRRIYFYGQDGCQIYNELRMKKTGAYLVTYALEQIGVKNTFGIPGVHNTEIYDELNKSDLIEPILVTHEGCASFMGDGLSRTSDSIGTLVIVPAAGMTHAMSGIGEAYLDGIPLLVISGGTRRDSGKHYQLHQLDQGKVLDGIIKKYWLVENHEDIIPTIYEAYEVATTGEPGPVFVEIPVELQLFRGVVDGLPKFSKNILKYDVDKSKIKNAVDLLVSAKCPGLFLGWGARYATDEAIAIAELLEAPVSTTLQGLSVFPANHKLHTGVGFGPASVPASQNAFKNCDCLLAVGTRFGELATGSFGVNVPDRLIHIDINPEVFNKNYPAKIALHGDAKELLKAIVEELATREIKSITNTSIASRIAKDKKKYLSEWKKSRQKNIVSPGYFFESLRDQTPDDCLVLTDDGKHTFLTAELFPVYKSRHFISPTDFNCMGYCVPASIGAKIANRDKMVISIVGDGAFLMTCMELVTATTQKAGIIVFVFNDGELGQISQFQKIPLNRKTCTKLGKIRVEGVATATGASFLSLQNDFEIEGTIKKAIEISENGVPVLVDVNIDYSKKTFLTKGVVKANLSRFPLNEKIRFLGRALKRHTLG